MPNRWYIILFLLVTLGCIGNKDTVGIRSSRRIFSVSLAWDASLDTGITEYIVKYGTSPYVHTNQVSAGLSLTKTVTGLVEGYRYYFVVTCKTSSQESPESNVATYRQLTSNPPVYILLQSELATIDPPMEIREGTDPIMGSGPLLDRYVVSTNNDSGTVTFFVNVPYVDDYTVWARIFSTDDGHDSFYVSLNNSEEDVYDTVYSYGLDWKWTTVNGRGGTDKPVTDAHKIDPRLFFLTGQDSITFRCREQGTPLDAIVITNDRGFRPISPPPPFTLQLTIEQE